MPGPSTSSLFVFGARFARLVCAAVRSDARIAGFVGEAVLIVPAVVIVDAACEFLIALVIGSIGAESRLHAGLGRCVGVLEKIEWNVRRTLNRARRSCGLDFGFDRCLAIGFLTAPGQRTHEMRKLFPDVDHAS